MNKLVKVGAGIGAATLLATQQAHAALAEGVTDGITAAQTDLVALYTALTAAGVVIFVARIVYRKFTVR